jgi:hypothetical protein
MELAIVAEEGRGGRGERGSGGGGGEPGSLFKRPKGSVFKNSMDASNVTRAKLERRRKGLLC